ncbi:carboxypeptidase-like regulatory domain-containing protein [Psychroserpens damuponensis]|uniref:carboxypeptidase-like regulatory domain-containing protein n=1 Tax=Psychroserpens damuponensis TaxID=943936 RepID=UPI00058DEAB5|nr:carboxypeptidase-like regulatory domain-containing protein [Psychroserpens damuponensis]
MTTLKQKFVLIAFFIIPLFSFSQHVSELLCKILDTKTSEPVMFASVAVKDQNVGVISDDDGSFRLPITYKRNNTIIIISCIGYRTLEVDVSTLASNHLNILKLDPQIESLSVVTIIAEKDSKKEKADYIPVRDIVRKAIQNIPLNYPTNAHSYIGYYREYQVLNNSYFNLNEGIMEEFDAGFHTNKLFYKDNQAALYSFKQNTQFPQDTVLSKAYDNKNLKFIEQATISGFGGNELCVLHMHNTIRNYEKQSFSFVDVFKENFLYNHVFRLANKTYLNGKPIYEIKFYATEAVAGVKNTATGVIYIAYDTFAIHKIEYNGFEKNNEKPFYSLTVEYVPKYGKMYLNYISFYNSFKAKSVNSFKINSVEFDADDNAFLVSFSNAIDTKTITKKKRFKFNYNDERLRVSKVEVLTNKQLKISLDEDLSIDEVEDFKTLKGIDYKIRHVLDLAGRKLNELTFIDADQFREYFVQEVFKSKAVPNNLIFVNKIMPLSKSKINNHALDVAKYWINSPLKTTKN